MERLTPSADQILQFLLALPATDDIDGWVHQFKDELCKLLSDVDRVSLYINFDYESSQLERAQIALIREIDGSKPAYPHEPPPTDQEEAVSYFRGMGHSVDHYRLPAVLDLLTDREGRIATLYLWRNREAAPISEQTYLLVLSLYALMLNLFQNVIRGYSIQQAEQRLFIARLARLAHMAKINLNQNRVLILLLSGYSYREIAYRMGVGVDAIGRTVGRIYKKACVNSITELYTKYFIPSNVDLSVNGSNRQRSQSDG